MGFFDKIFGENDAEARINNLLATNRKLTDMLSLIFTSHQQTINQLAEKYNEIIRDIEKIKNYIKEERK